MVMAGLYLKSTAGGSDQLNSSEMFLIIQNASKYKNPWVKTCSTTQRLRLCVTESLYVLVISSVLMVMSEEGFESEEEKYKMINKMIMFN